MDLESNIPAYDELSDGKLMKLVAEGDQDAFDQVYLRYKAKVRKFIGGFVVDDATAEDLLQETFLRVYQNAQRYRPTHKLASWVYRIATNLCLNELRRRRAHPVVSLNQQIQVAMTDSESETVELHELIPDSAAAAPSRAAESAETMQEIASALASLSSVQQEVITMRLWDELDYRQIAGALNVSVGTAKSRAFYGLRALRDKLDDGC
jgi:RNA polymerase sigma-70 factor (ECF subfamily)